MIEDGHSIGAAARSNGITVQTFFNWMERGQEADSGPFMEFFDRITRARGVGEKQYVEAIVEIARETEDTATLMSLLKSRYPDAWADVDRGEQTSGGVEVVVPETEPPQ
jgi:transposase-like protein